jgi:methylphosphotriester-DNA--protein-cysteine methyltransferase
VTLRRQFDQEFGVTLREYHLRSRLIEALRLFVSGRRDARSALHAAGWSSPKCFYRSVLRVTGMSVRQIRELDSKTVLRLVALPGARRQQKGVLSRS